MDGTVRQATDTLTPAGVSGSEMIRSPVLKAPASRAAMREGDGPEGWTTVERTYKTFYGVLREAARWLVGLGVTHVAMEATGIYSMPVYRYRANDQLGTGGVHQRLCR
jgi:hypothetical protein